jgi:hypothetical protein
VSVCMCVCVSVCLCVFVRVCVIFIVSSCINFFALSNIFSYFKLKTFAVKSARKTPFTLDKAISLPELHLPSCGSIFSYVMENIAHWESGGCASRLLCA